MAGNSVKDTLARITALLVPHEQGLDKAAADGGTGKDEGDPNATSNAEHIQIKELEEEEEGSTKQRNLGVEQQQAAEDAGSTIKQVPDNTDADAKRPTDDQGPSTLDIDQPAAQNSEVLGQVKKQEINMEQKLAAHEKMANAILAKLAACTIDQPKTKAEPAATDDTGEGQEKTAAEQVFGDLQKAAQAAADRYYLGYLYGAMHRVQKEAELYEGLKGAGLNDDAIEKLGGVPALLDKVALEDPGAVLPPDVGLPPEMLGEAPADEGAAEEEALMEALSEAGISPEQLVELAQVVEELQAGGAAPEDIGAAGQALDAEMLAGDDTATEPPPEETGSEGEGDVEDEDEEKTAAADKVASIMDRLRPLWQKHAAAQKTSKTDK